MQINTDATANPPRFPLRWRWTMLVGAVVATSILVLAWGILDMERDAWLESLELQAKNSVNRLGNELKIPMLSGSAAEVESIARSFLQTVPIALTVHVQYVNGKQQQFNHTAMDNIAIDPAILNQIKSTKTAARFSDEQLWFAKQIDYGGTSLGAVAVRYSEEAWEALAGRLLKRMFFAASLVIVLASIFVFWIAGKLSLPIEKLAAAADQVAAGDYSVRLAVQGNDEISDATKQFNHMVKELAHKERMRDAFGKYLNPKLVSEVFEGSSGHVENTTQDVTVLFADMVGFTSFSESCEPAEIVEVLNKHFEVFHRIIDYFGGHVDKYIGDAVMAVFNHPNEDTEHARHASLAAIAMTIACRKLGVLRQNGEAISFRVGLNCGQVIVGSIGAAERLEYTVIGDTVNIASRMGGLGDGGELVASRASYTRLGDGFSFDSMGKKNIKGVKDAIECGRIIVRDEATERQVLYAVALAFDLTLPSDIRLIIGDINT
ncbi:MAG: adenylate/guanylate cyclase domain-containing protein [Mariprofundaceae bacterium]|nr:adenylate/guanylate cyclase domain-containing protein [Mariprofundaceae bacterium]